MPSHAITLYGAGGHAREIAWLASACGIPVCCFIDDDPAKAGTSLNGIEVLSVNDAKSRYPSSEVIVAIGTPKIRERLVETIARLGFDFCTLIHPRVERSAWIRMGRGVAICAGNVLTTNIMLGDHVQINTACTIAHDVVIGAYSTLAPGVHVSGCVTIGRRVYLGTGSTIINGTPDRPLVIGDDAFIGAGACVTKSVPCGTTVVGVPARPIVRSVSSEELV